MAEKEKSIMPGVVLILIGLVLLLRQLGVVDLRWRYLYPIVLLCLGILFLVSMFTKGDKGAIFPATVLLVLGLFFILRNFALFDFGFYFYEAREFWPIFPVAFGAGFVALFFFRENDWGVLLVGGILLFLGVVFFLREFGFYFWYDLLDYWPVILILVGLSIIISHLRRKTG